MCLLLENGLTALHKASYNGQPEICEILLKNNANVTAEDEVSMLRDRSLFLPGGGQ